MTELKSYLNKEVLIENNRGSKYLGTLVGFRNNRSRFCLAGLVILDKEYNTRCASKSKTTRWFNVDQFKFQLADECEGLKVAIRESTNRAIKKRTENYILNIYQKYDNTLELRMNIKVNPLHMNREKNIFDYFNFFGYGNADSQRQTGRSTAIALATISKAIDNPYQWIQVKDHSTEKYADLALHALIEKFVTVLELKHFVFDRDEFRIAFGDPQES